MCTLKNMPGRKVCQDARHHLQRRQNYPESHSSFPPILCTGPFCASTMCLARNEGNKDTSSTAPRKSKSCERETYKRLNTPTCFKTKHKCYSASVRAAEAETCSREHHLCFPSHRLPWQYDPLQELYLALKFWHKFLYSRNEGKPLWASLWVTDCWSTCTSLPARGPFPSESRLLTTREKKMCL